MKRAVVVALFIAIALASIGPIRNYDLFWHLATGRWIAEHRALPRTDPFALASDRGPWINGEWLFELVLYAVESVAGVDGLSYVRALLFGALFALLFLFAARRSVPAAALLLTALAFAGAVVTLDLRPATLAAFFVMIAVAIARTNKWLIYALLIAVWINVHPSAVLAPVIALLVARRWPITLAGVAALFLNPFGVQGVLAPLELTLFATSGAFVNAEWLPSAPLVFPLLYLTIVVAAAAFVMKHDDWGAIALALLFAILAVRHIRNQPLWFAAFPLLVEVRWRRAPQLAYLASAALVAFGAVRAEHGLGVSPARFPLEAVARLHATGLRGNFYNPDQFGGFLIWSFYPERRTLTDGRNELYHQFIPEYAVARRDQRAWRALLRKYRIDLAVDEYRPPLDVLDAVSRQHTRMPASLAYWPRSQWALIGYDRAAMVFARRAAFPGEQVDRWEIRGVVPDAPR